MSWTEQKLRLVLQVKYEILFLNVFSCVDINDAVTISNLPLPAALSLAENTALATQVFTVSYQDQDTSQAHTFTMTSSPSTGTNYFSIDSSSKFLIIRYGTVDWLSQSQMKSEFKK